MKTCIAKTFTSYLHDSNNYDETKIVARAITIMIST